MRHTLAVCATALALSAGSALAQARAISSPLDTTVRRVVVRPPGYPRITDTASLVSRLRGAFAATRAAPRGMRRPGGAVVALASPYAPDVDLTLANPGASIERSQCVSVALKPRVAYECGALRLAYPLPTLTTLTQARTPTLVYRSDHAAPQPIVRAWVARPAAAPVPTQVTATLTLAQESQPRATATWSGSAWTSTAPQQIALSFDALEAPRLQTQVYGYTLRVTFTFADGATAAAEPTGELAIVNRADSPFGPGWWLAGYESLYAVPDSARPVADYFWVGGDGSTRRFRYAGVRADNWTIWVASPAVDRVDTLSYAPDGWFRRHLGDGAYTRFDGSPRLRHTFTDAPTGHSTQFVSYWNQCGRLGTIWVPTPGAAGPGDWQNGRWWSFNYDADDLPDPACTRPARLTSSGASAVTASGIRWTWVTTTSTWGSFHDQASGRTVYVCYAADRRICGYQDRVGQISDFLYGSGGLFAEARLRTDTTPTSPYFTHRFQPGEAVALAGPRDTLTAVTRLTNPRGFATEIALTRFGAPRRITDATGRTTNLAYGDARFPGLPTWVRTPAYFSSYATYDARGNLTQLQQDAMGGEDFATTRYEYHPVWNRPTVLTSPAGVTEYRGYRADYPALEWAQLGPSPARRTSFGYCASECPAGLLRRVTAPVTPQGNAPTDWYSYDGLGNLRQTLSAAGKERRLGRDRLGRVVRDSTLVAQGTSRPWRVDSIGFDTGDRVTSVTSSAAAIADGAASVTLEVRTAYDSEDRPTSVRRWSLPDPRSIGTLVDSMRHDALGRVVWRRPTGAGASYDSTGYDGAGNVTFTRSRQGRVLRMQYDALDRLTSRRGDPVVYAARAGTPGTPHSSIQFPEYNLSPTSRFATRAVVDTFTYEAETGQLRSARNAAAWVDRYYRLDGRLNAEYLRVNTTNGSDFTKHAYGVGYAYDSAGRQIALQIPWELAPNVTDNLGENYVRYTYEPETGWLSTVRDPLGNTTTFAYNNLGDLQTV
ncbi:MAG: hypothetical protein MUE41_12230, partial [Gemmatimonadaceae bacterium]|nr:hypothetical protein [Gemmatimonadaceae bacterium]